ncbi:hypothetical protein BDQ94DRAFT_132334 [Aspergillus welwitschiae]|uniref:Uncharacterized protein n=1 Tax=Aspergillus welwitschiae TaxID=1341132 RepID=A0A3F3QJ04_9EURO|nr:hypothetical protein BDQ94DRAFT_132334 [Aspergillus welwitschiae]RDH39085.1 hypothetical protein BDQ94DRAFT_132334 [Aspergillus welwitschiae]
MASLPWLAATSFFPECSSTTDTRTSCAFSGERVIRRVNRILSGISTISLSASFGVVGGSSGITSLSMKIFFSCRVANLLISFSEGKKFFSNSAKAASHSTTFS